MLVLLHFVHDIEIDDSRGEAACATSASKVFTDSRLAAADRPSDHNKLW
jgi:hypothetical protein